jgi:hypothetical protein
VYPLLITELSTWMTDVHAMKNEPKGTNPGNRAIYQNIFHVLPGRA